MNEDHGGHDPELTLFLRRLAGGDERQAATLMPHVYGELRAIAEGYLRGGHASHTLQPTAMVNEAYLRLFDRERLQINDRQHFFRLAARAMRQLLVDHARKRRSEKRGGGRRDVTLDEAVAAASGLDVDWIDLDQALGELALCDARQAQVVELRYFAGLEVADAAKVLGISVSTVEQDWRSARAWLGARLREQEPS
jgi:RNA polymerase sigma factor (TIGR02999 family)